MRRVALRRVTLLRGVAGLAVWVRKKEENKSAENERVHSHHYIRMREGKTCPPSEKNS